MMVKRSLALTMTMMLLANKTLAFNCVRQGSRRILRLPTRCHASTSNEALDAGGARSVHQVTWKTADGDVSFQVGDGEILRTAALRREVISPHNGRARLINCRGLGTCGTCAVEINGTVEPLQRNSVESVRLSLPPHGSQSSKLRLACQVQVRGDVTVTKRTGFWGQYADLAEKSEPETYFGDLEFVLDTRSPSSGADDGKAN